MRRNAPLERQRNNESKERKRMFRATTVRKCVPILLPPTIHHVCNKLKKRGNMLFIIEIFGVLFNFGLYSCAKKETQT